jgi:hypothetical protein
LTRAALESSANTTPRLAVAPQDADRRPSDYPIHTKPNEGMDVGMSKHDHEQAQWRGPTDAGAPPVITLSTVLLIYCILPFIAAVAVSWYWDQATPSANPMVNGGADRIRGDGCGSSSPSTTTPSPCNPTSTKRPEAATPRCTQP